MKLPAARGGQRDSNQHGLIEAFMIAVRRIGDLERGSRSIQTLRGQHEIGCPILGDILNTVLIAPPPELLCDGKLAPTSALGKRGPQPVAAEPEVILTRWLRRPGQGWDEGRVGRFC